LRRNLPALGDAINLQLNSIPIQPKQYPDPISHEKWTAQRGTSLGAGISLKENGLTLDLEVYWWLDEGGEVPSILASATISLWNKGKFERAWPKFEKSQAKKYEEPGNYCIYFSEHVLAGEMSTLDIKLTTALETLIRAWVEAGGLKAFLQ
jgi:hypothetical protein